MNRMPQKELEYRDYRIQYVCFEDHVRITGYGGTAVAVRIPDRIDGLPVTEIEKKVFLSRKKLKRVMLPNSLTEIGDWAFAYCTGLEEITFPRHHFKYGKGIFLECGQLKKIAFEDSMQLVNEDISVLMAAALTQFDAYYLFDPEHAGDEEWIAKWDFKLRQFLETDDMEGYTKTVLCGEEDYGGRDNILEFYLDKRRREKVRMILLRLLHPYGVKESFRTEMATYLQNHRKGAQEGEQSWRVVLEEYPDSLCHYELLGECNCILEENVDAMLTDLGESHAEMKAFLLRYKHEKLNHQDFFAGFSLDSW